ncbi:MAG: hypothetical protein AAGH64_00720 [Planctomycetota bacterium]
MAVAQACAVVVDKGREALDRRGRLAQVLLDEREVAEAGEGVEALRAEVGSGGTLGEERVEDVPRVDESSRAGGGDRFVVLAAGERPRLEPGLVERAELVEIVQACARGAELVP